VGDRKEASALGVFWRVSPRGKATKVDSKFICPNGPAFSPTAGNAISPTAMPTSSNRYEIEPNGKIGARHLFAGVPAVMACPTA